MATGPGRGQGPGPGLAQCRPAIRPRSRASLQGCGAGREENRRCFLNWCLTRAPARLPGLGSPSAGGWFSCGSFQKAKQAKLLVLCLPQSERPTRRRDPRGGDPPTLGNGQTLTPEPEVPRAIGTRPLWQGARRGGVAESESCGRRCGDEDRAAWPPAGVAVGPEEPGHLLEPHEPSTEGWDVLLLGRAGGTERPRPGTSVPGAQKFTFSPEESSCRNRMLFAALPACSGARCALNPPGRSDDGCQLPTVEPSSQG
ncbi:hypothetical protein SUZIE_128120 [Sciurus carolinensis]|uniref:Uncharacterized protein n=1 Tax=Sciurus carolinensis TaxID=30640 RepID=A0AA41SWQ7_SCICA|nr:hypothetical protein [Sciurus carolinensis]